MNALLLSAGFGKRLLPLTKTTPKPLLKIRGEPLLKKWIVHLKSLNINDIIINYHYLPNIFDDFFLENFNCNIIKKYEPKILGTGGSFEKYINLLDENDINLVAHSDNYFNFSLENFVNFSRKNLNKNHFMSVMIFETDDPSSCGIYECDGIYAKSFIEKPKFSKSKYASSAIFIFNNFFIEHYKNELINQNIFDFSADVLPKIVQNTILYKADGKITDIGSLDNFNYLNNPSSKNNNNYK